MSVINFPTFEERLRTQRRKGFDESVDIFPEPIRTQVVNDCLAYVDRLSVPSSMQLEVAEGLSASQVAAIEAGFNVFTKQVNETLLQIFGELVNLRFKTAACEMLHGANDSNPAA